MSLRCSLAVFLLAITCFGCAPQHVAKIGANDLRLDRIVFDGIAPNQYGVISIDQPLSSGDIYVTRPFRALRVNFAIDGVRYYAVVGRNQNEDSAHLRIAAGAPVTAATVSLSEGFLYYVGGRWPITSGRRISLSTPNFTNPKFAAVSELAFQLDPGSDGNDRIILAKAAKQLTVECSTSMPGYLTKANAFIEADDKCVISSEKELSDVASASTKSKFDFIAKIADVAK